jgi:hypothetical protein
VHTKPLHIALVLAALGCGHSEAARKPASTAPSPAAENDAPDRAAHMQATFWLAVVARDAVIGADLEAAKRAASGLAAHDYGGALPEDWHYWVTQMQQRADEVALAPDLASAARAVASLSLSCGDCHAQKRVQPRLSTEAAMAWKDPPEDLHERMYRHALGAEQLWHGLIQPSEEMWRNGTLTLTRAPLEPALQDGEAVSPEMTAKIEEIRELAKRARVASSHPERAAIYGELITRCAECHYLSRID